MDQEWWCYFRLTLHYLSFLLINEKNYSMGLSQGEYWELKSTWTLLYLRVSMTRGCLCILALSMKTTISLPMFYGRDLRWLIVWNRKFSNSTPLTLPSINWLEITSFKVMADSKLTENIYNLLSLTILSLDILNEKRPYGPSWSRYFYFLKSINEGGTILLNTSSRSV